MRRITLFLALFLGSCAHPVDLFVIDPATGEVGATQIDARQTSGPIYLQFRGENYSGTWVSVRDTGYTTTGFGFTGRSVFTTAGVAEADAGNAVANLRSSSGNSLRCQIRYGFNQRTFDVVVTGFGQCVDQSGAMYDVQGTSASVGSRLQTVGGPATVRTSSGAFPPITSSGGP